MEYASFVAIWEVESEVYNQNLISLESILHIIIIITTIIILLLLLLLLLLVIFWCKISDTRSLCSISMH